MYHLLVIGVVLGAWAYCFTMMVEPGEIFAGWGRWVNIRLHGMPTAPDPMRLQGWRYLLWKYTYCNFCLAGGLSVAFALLTLQPAALFFCPPLAMVTTQLLNTWTNKY